MYLKSRTYKRECMCGEEGHDEKAYYVLNRSEVKFSEQIAAQLTHSSDVTPVHSVLEIPALST